MNKNILIFSVLTIALFFQKLGASHMMGADMTYICLGNGKYHLIAKVYRDCRGISFANPDFGVFGGTNGGNGCGQYNLSISRTKIRDVSPKCSTSKNPCNPQNSPAGEGIEEHTYEVTVDFNTAPLNNFTGKSSCCEVTFFIGQNARNGAITTGPANQYFVSTCMINICNIPKTNKSCNSSPYLSNAPIGFLCCNEVYTFNNGAIDTADHDSLSYKLVPGLAGLPKTSVTYASPFSYQYPMTPYCVPPGSVKCNPSKSDPPKGFFMDTGTGDLVFTPTKCDEVGIVVIEITEWRKDTATDKYIVIGKTRRDMQLIVKDDCGYNKAPRVIGPTTSKVCEGDKICFNIEGKDETFTPFQPIPDTVQMKWNGGIPGATFVITNPKDREKIAEFCWQTKVGQASDIAYSFTVTATDDHCINPSFAVRGFKVKVNPRAFAKRIYTPLKCGKFAYESKIPDGFKGVASYKWSFRDSNGNNEFYFSSKRTDTMIFKQGGRFIVVHTINNSDNCPTIYRDTIDVPNPPTVVMATKDTFACYKTKIELHADVLYAKWPYKYYWTRPNFHQAGDTFQDLTLHSVDRDSTLQVRITDGDGCIFYDTATVFMKPLPIKPLMEDQRICTYQQATFDAEHADTMFYLWNSGDTSRTITKNVAGDYIVTLTDTIWGCQMKDTVHLFVNDTVVALAGADKTICTRDKYDITANHRNSNLGAQYQWTDLAKGTNLGSNTTYNVGPVNTNPPGGPAQFFPYQLWVRINQVGVTCEDYDTMVIKVNTLPVVTWTKNPLDPKCHDYGNIKLNPLVTAPASNLRNADNFRIWGVNTKYGPLGLVDSAYTGSSTENLFNFATILIDNDKELSGPGAYVDDKLTVWFKDTNGCVNTATTTQKINGNPVIVLDTPTWCQDLGVANLDKIVIRPKTKFGTIQTWSVVSVPGGVDGSNILVDQTTHWEMHFGNTTEDFYAGDYILKFAVTDQVTQCFGVDTTLVHIITEPTVEVTQPNPVCLNDDTMDLRSYVLLNSFTPEIGPNNPDNIFKIVEYNFDRADPKVTSTPLYNGYMFLPGSGAGNWLIKFSSNETGCLKEDSFYIIVNDTPTATILAPLTLCSSSTPLNLDTRVTNKQPGSATGMWSAGAGVPSGMLSGSNFSPISQDLSTLEGPYTLKYALQDDNGCKGNYIYRITVRSRPEVEITSPKPLEGCEDKIFDVTSVPKYSNNDAVIWTRINGADGNIDNTASKDIKYTGGTQDKVNHYAWLKVTTVAIPQEVCPQASDSVQIILHQYPDLDTINFNEGCVPLVANFNITEKNNINKALLAWKWYFGNGDSSTQEAPTGVNYPIQGKYDVRVIVTNTAGNCQDEVTRSAAHAYPIPTAAFISDPPYSTTVALPKFKFTNQSTLDKSVFTNGTMKYTWDFDDPITDPSDTSSAENPRYAYGKDTNTYDITLTVTSDKGCVDVVTRTVVVGPDIIVFIPDVFTPDGAGPPRNNTFRIEASNFRTMKMMIYNRWGEKMYETDDINKGWDGRANGANCQQDVYVYHVEVLSFEGKLYKFDGTVTLLR